MSIEKLMKPVTILRRVESGEEDEYGDPVLTIQEVAGKAALQRAQRANEEPGTQGELSDTRWVGSFPTGTDLRTSDAIRTEVGELFELVGEPWDAREGSARMWHVEASLRRTAGAEDGS